MTFAASCLGCSNASDAEASLPPTLEPPELLRASLRRLTAGEYARAASELASLPVQSSLELPLDTTLLGFSANADAVVDALFASRLHDVAQRLAQQAVETRLSELLPCAMAATPDCAASFVDTFVSRAFRRPISADERIRYRAVFAAGQNAGDFRSGVQLVLTALLESPSFLYLTELGAEPSSETIELSQYEVAAQLAFALTGGPPDLELLQAAERGELGMVGRQEHAARLLRQYETRFQFRRFVAEWLGLSGETGAKSLDLFPEFHGLRSAMLEETDRFVDAVMIQENGSMRALLAGGFGLVPPALESFYGVTAGPDGRAELAGVGRVGLLQQANFLSRFAHVAETAPVLRGVFVLRRLLCRTLPSAAELGIEITFPEPDPRRTTRQRYSAHASDPRCAACHEAIDGVGFSFENFDAIGRLRTLDAGQPIDTRGRIGLESGHVDFDGSAELAQLLAEAPEVERCMQRHVLRFVSGRSEAGAERAFAALAASLGDEVGASIIDLMLGLVESELFVRRRRE
jgi:hypothetical protein